MHEINGQPFIAGRVGQRKVLHALHDYCAYHQVQADQADSDAEEIALELTRARRAVELADIKNQPTAPLRIAADDLQSRINEANRTATIHRQAIDEALTQLKLVNP